MATSENAQPITPRPLSTVEGFLLGGVAACVAVSLSGFVSSNFLTCI